MDKKIKSLLFLLFLGSGFCGLLYQLVWIRIAYAEFGVITPVMSIIISVFMLGLSLGSWVGGKWILSLTHRYRISAIFYYAVTELIIGIGAFAVPKLFSGFSNILLAAGEMNSAKYLFLSSIAISASILPWCILMGFTFPFMMQFIKELKIEDSTSFSYLYYANVIGATIGTLISAIVFIELLGFKNTLTIAAGINFMIALSCTIWGIRKPYFLGSASDNVAQSILSSGGDFDKDNMFPQKMVLFFTGFISMGMEVVWIRGFTPVLSTTTYSFASLLSVYLISTCIGTLYYRRSIKKNKEMSIQKIVTGLSAFSLLPLVMTDPRLNAGIPLVLISIVLFSAALGCLTPLLIDRYSNGDPKKAGRAYAYNIVGCIIGPVVASYLLLPYAGVKNSLLLLSAPILIFVLIYYKKTVFEKDWSIILSSLALVLFVYAGFVNVSYEEAYAKVNGSVIHRDYAASTISYGSGMKKQLLVNGIGMTSLTPITKVMAHLPLSYCKNKPESALSVCFGMGTTHRSFLSWGIKSTAVELVPGVIDSFGYYHSDSSEIIGNPNGKIVIDDGRRFLKRTTEKYDVITIDPPPPVEAAGSSLLYSEEFYTLIKSRLKDGGILHHWFPYGENRILNAIAMSLKNSFPYIQTYSSVAGWGVHFICSSQPLKELTADEMTSIMPEKAKKDLVEWHPIKPEDFIKAILSNKTKISDYLSVNDDVKIIDDKPYNEYYILRRLF